MPAMGKKQPLVILGLLVGLIAQGYLLYWVSSGWKETVDWRGIVFEALLFLFVFFWNVAVLPHFKSTRTLSLGSLIFLAGTFTDVHDEFFLQPRWVNIVIEDPTLAIGAGLIGLGIWFWVKEKEQLLDQLEKERDFEASLIPKLSHDLRVPLSNVSGMVGLLDEDPGVSSDPRWREGLDFIWRGLQEMHLLIENILETHRLKSGTVELRPTVFALVPLLDETSGDFHYQVKKHGITIVKDCPEGEMLLEADRVKVMRVIQNLLANAIKFSSKGGKVTLKATAAYGEITVRVMDEGPGIPKDRTSGVLQKDPATARDQTEGTSESFGIGLNVVREFVHLHGGRFWVEPNVPRGAQFCFTLPAQPALGVQRADVGRSIGQA
jgi:signal transduction histidine kinase